MAVVAPFELENLGLPGDATRQTDGAHRRLRTARHKSDALGVRVVVKDHAPQLIF